MAGDAGYVFTAVQDAQAVSTAVDLFHITVATDRPVLLHWLELGQTTDLGDANEEVLRIGIYRGVTGGGGGTALTEVATDSRTSASGSAAVVGQGTASTGGTLVWLIFWNIRQAGPVWVPTPEIRPRTDAGSDPIAFRLMAAPADAITLSATVAWEEL